MNPRRRVQDLNNIAVANPEHLLYEGSRMNAAPTTTHIVGNLPKYPWFSEDTPLNVAASISNMEIEDTFDCICR